MNDLDQIKQKLLVTMDVLHGICEKNGLKYYLFDGTLLGAVRHQGFIPWDDDIDVAIPRGDYNKLLKLANNFKSPYVMRDPSLEPDYIYPYAKLTNNTLIIEEDFYKPHQSGVWIDIFPLDFTFENITLQKLHLVAINGLRLLLILKCGAFKTTKYKGLSLLTLKLLHPLAKLIPRALLNALFNFFEQKVGAIFSRSSVYANFHGAWGIKESAPVSMLNERKLYDFEGRQFWSFKDTDFWLTKVYGDYMTPPSEEKRIPPHIGRIISVDTQ